MLAQHQSILVVDDDVDLRTAVTEFLDDEEFAVHVARNGREALDWLHHTRTLPSAIILDLSMPVMDGREFLTVRRDDPVLAQIPVVVVSAEHDASDLARREDVSEVLRKPFSLDHLLTAIEALDTRRR